MTSATTSLTYNTNFTVSMESTDPSTAFTKGGAVNVDLPGVSYDVDLVRYNELFSGMGSLTTANSGVLNAIQQYIRSGEFNGLLLNKFNAVSEKNVQWKSLAIGDTTSWFSTFVNDLKNSYAGVEFISGNSLQLVVKFKVNDTTPIVTAGFTCIMD
jgi:hypothetical protein